MEQEIWRLLLQALLIEMIHTDTICNYDHDKAPPSRRLS